MEYCVRHGTAIVVFDSGSFCPCQCPLCNALERIATLEQERREWDVTIMEIESERDMLHDEVRRLDVQLTALLRESVSDD